MFSHGTCGLINSKMMLIVPLQTSEGTLSGADTVVPRRIGPCQLSDKDYDNDYE